MEIIVIGTGGLAREFSTFFSKEINIIGFSSINIIEFENYKLSGKFFGSKITPSIVGTKYAVIAIGNPKTKQAVSDELKILGFEFPNLVHSSVINATNLKNSNSEGIIISPNCVIGSNVKFENHVYLNFMVGVGHDCKFKNYVQVNPGAQIGGSVSIDEGVMIGSNSSIRQGLKIGKDCTIGSGAVVLSCVDEGITIIGNPAKRLRIPKHDE